MRVIQSRSFSFTRLRWMCCHVVMKRRPYISQYYEDFEDLREQGLDALIITGANVTQAELSLEAFWQPLIEVADWAHENVTSTLCSCLATHAVLEFRYGQKREQQSQKKMGRLRPSGNRTRASAGQ